MNQSREVLLGIDLGTTGCKAIIFDLDGTTVAAASSEIRTNYPGPLRAEQSVDDWWDAVVQSVRSCMDRAPNVQVIGVGLSSQRETIVPISASGQAMGPAVLWMDRRSAQETVDLVNLFSTEWFSERTGMIPDATFTATKLLWMRRHEAQTHRNVWKWMQPRDYVAWRLTRNTIIDPSLAGRTMMFDIAQKRWINEVLEAVGVSEAQLPEIVPSISICGMVTNAVARELRIPDGTPVIAGGGDRACEALGLGIGGHRILESTGTTTNVTAVVHELPQQSRGVAIHSCHLIPGQWLVEQAMTTSGSIMRWFRDQVSRSAETDAQYVEIDTAASSVGVGAEGLLALPFFMGARATRWNSDAVGTLFGLTLRHDRGHMARAIMEGVAFEVRACLDLLRGILHTEVFDMWLAGGGAKAELWRQVKADVTKSRLSIPSVTEGACLGAAIAAGTALGLYSDPVESARRMNPSAMTITPEPSASIAYDGLYEIYNELYEAVAPSMTRLARWKDQLRRTDHSSDT